MKTHIYIIKSSRLDIQKWLRLFI